MDDNLCEVKFAEHVSNPLSAFWVLHIDLHQMNSDTVKGRTWEMVGNGGAMAIDSDDMLKEVSACGMFLKQLMTIFDSLSKNASRKTLRGMKMKTSRALMYVSSNLSAFLILTFKSFTTVSVRAASAQSLRTLEHINSSKRSGS